MAQPRIEMVEPSTPADQIDGILKRDGCVVIHDLVEPAALDALFAELGPWLERAKVSTGDFTGKNTKRMHGLVAKSPMVGEMLTHPKVTAIVDRMLGPWCDTFQLQACSTTSIGPGARPQPLHRDDLLYPFKHPMERNACCTFFWALTDFTKENGATRIVPRSQGLGRRARAPRGGDRAGRHAARLRRLLHGRHLPRRQRQHDEGRMAPRHVRGLHPRLAAPGGEPVPGLPTPRRQGHAG